MIFVIYIYDEKSSPVRFGRNSLHLNVKLFSKLTKFWVKLQSFIFA